MVNNDDVPEAFGEAAKTSTNMVLKDGARITAEAGAGAAEESGGGGGGAKGMKRRGSKAAGVGGSGGGGERKSRSGRSSVVTSFATSIRSLTATLEASQCNFIRCIKPNEAMRPDMFDWAYVGPQLQAIGVMQACEVLKVGLPTRVPYTALNRLSSGLPEAMMAPFRNKPPSVLVAAILWAFDIDPKAYVTNLKIQLGDGDKIV